MATQTQALQPGPQGALDAVRDYLKNGEVALAIGILAILVVLLLPPRRKRRRRRMQIG